ncbi:MAG: MFS transporter [Clostridia bacterium]|nr:MFS transporter [Clostridia bacterium]
MKKKSLGFRTKLAYGSGNLGYGAMGQTVSSFVMFYATSVLGLPGAVVGVIIAITSLWDGLSDPIIGYLSDRTRSKIFGRRLGHMLFASFALAINNVLLWSCPAFSQKWASSLWLLIFLLTQETFNTFFATPYAALCIDIAPDYSDQTNIQGFKTVFSIFGMILPSLLMSVFMPGGNAQFDRHGYVNIALVNGVIVIVCGLIATFGTIRRVHAMPNYYVGIEKEKKEKHGLKKILQGYAETFKKKDFRVVMLGYSVCLIAMMFLSSVGMHLFTFCYGFSGLQISALMICLFGGAIISQPIWVSVVKKYDKKQTLIFALCVILFGLGFVSITFLFRLYCSSNLIFWFVAPSLLFSGLGAGALYSLPHSMYADVVTMEQFKTGENNAGRYTGYYTFTYNFSNSIALLFIGVLLQTIGFNSNESVQTLEVQAGLGKLVFLGSAIAITIAILIFSEYSLKRSDVLKVQIKANEGLEDKNT